MKETMPGAAPTEPPAPIDFESLYSLQTNILEHLLSGASPHEVLNHVCRTVEQQVPHSVCSIMLYDADRHDLSVAAAPHVAPDVVEQLNGLRPSERGGSCGSAVYQGEPVLVADTRTDPSWGDMREFAEQSGIRACWSVPVSPDGERILGTFAISRSRPGLPAPTLMAILESAGHVAGLALQALLNERNKASKERLMETVVDEAEDCIWVKDTNGCYLYANRAEQETCAHGGTIVGLFDDDIYSQKNARLNRLTDQEVIRTHKPVVYMAHYPSAGEQTRLYHVKKSPRIDSEGRVVEIIGIARDVTDQELAQEALQNDQKLESLGLLAGGVAHDFNNILVGILGNAEWLVQACPGQGPVQEAVREIRHAADRAAGLTRQMLSYAGQSKPSREALQIPQLLRDVLELVKRSLSRTASISLTFEEPIPHIHADPTQLRQVLMNLLVNASEALDEHGGQITVLARAIHATETDPPPTLAGPLKPGHYVCITVRDNGHGMDSYTQSRIFDPFFTTKSNKGRGLGLAAVLGIVRSHGGAVSVRSDTDSGTEFHVYLPVGSHPETVTRNSEPLHARLALVVDDEPVVRSVTRRLLESEGYDVITAADGTEALSVVRERGADLCVAIVDHNMPGLSGAETCRRIRSLDHAPPVLLTTGGVLEVHAKEFVVLPKPYRRHELVAAVEMVMSERQDGEQAAQT